MIAYNYDQVLDNAAWRKYLAEDRRACERPPPFTHYENGSFYSHNQLHRLFNSHHQEDPRMAPSNTGRDYFPPLQLQANQSEDGMKD